MRTSCREVLTGPAARSHELLSLVARQLLQQAQALGPPGAERLGKSSERGLAFALQAFGRRARHDRAA